MVKKSSTNSNLVTTNQWRRWWKGHAASTSGVERRPTQPLASTQHGTLFVHTDEQHYLTRACFSGLFIEYTNTHSCSSEAFKQGGRRGAKKVMIVITDGESHDSADLKQAIEDSEKDDITRYAIAVSLKVNKIYTILIFQLRVITWFACELYILYKVVKHCET